MKVNRSSSPLPKQSPKGKYTSRLNDTKNKGFHESFRNDPEFFLQVIDSLQDYAVFTTDREGNVSSWNSGSERILGYTEKEIIGKNAIIFYVAEDRETFDPVIELTMSAQKGRAPNERWHVRKDGSRFWGSGLVFPLKDENGEIRGFTKIMRDLTERKESIIRLRESEERYRTFVMNTTEGIWRFELEKPMSTKDSVKKQIEHMYRYAYLAECNDIVARMYGYKKADDITGGRLGDFLIRTDKQNIEYLTAFIRSGYRLADMESVEKDKFGEEKHFLNSLIGIVEDGFVYRAWGMQRDVTEQKKIQSSLSLLAAIVQYSEDAILTRTLDGTITSWNKGAEKMYGYKAEEVIGKDIRVLIPKDRHYEADAIVDKIKADETIAQVEQLRHRRDGTEIPISLSVSPLLDERGKLIGISTIARDIRERVRLQKQKDEFIGIASHELKTPVTSIKAYTQVMLHRFAKKKDESAVLLLRKMDAQLDKLNGLISDLLDVTNIETGKIQLNLGFFDFNELAEEIIEEMQRTTDHVIETRLDTSKTVYGDRDRIGQVLMNLISNAIKYSPKKKKIVIQTEVQKRQLTLCVQDFGVGIPKDKQDKIFERFFRVSGPHQNTFPGMGLGLYISSEIIKRQGGRIWVESHKGKGSTFCFTIPLRTKVTKTHTGKHTE